MNKNDNQRQQTQKGKGWSFRYFGGTPAAPSSPDEPVTSSSFPLTQAKSGTQVWVVGFRGKGGISRLLGMGLTPGIELQVLSTQHSGSVVVAIADNRLGLGAGMAEKIMVTDEPLNRQQEQTTMETQDTSIYLRQMPSGSVGRILGYEKSYRAYKSKLLSMGLTPGTEFTVIRVAPFGDPIEINVRGFNLSLRKQEADALVVEVLR
ncbi:FeoA family protein [Limnoraphis robusta Tam1]|uniref:FeoA family protein n=2 Tax=Limnoraphis TaxID=1332112 RepID=A0ABU5TZ56_9CYAN|nr:FeoA family protein [Limnoraphis robusta]MEA5500634.1 FeoA family protein [Limnoraphis robusta BA-68 BA1]MEA5520211.1 FeoA family protein [Limnoraphis robusta CCNP1315]MEA5542237.1 FeoA family protein [Limnoraphis robusta Tam1]MEA5546735.1 FeoA family protein [Limnoraphis robusta CCNP1324]